MTCTNTKEVALRDKLADILTKNVFFHGLAIMIHSLCSHGSISSGKQAAVFSEKL